MNIGTDFLISAAHYRTLLLDNIVPFWLSHGIDETRGGILTCLRDDGSVISQDKYLWSQGRAIWTFAALYNRIDSNPRFLEIARDIAEFVLRHGRDSEGAFVFRVSRDGEPLEPAISAYADYFVVYGLTELFRATREDRYLEEALGIFRRVAPLTRDPDFDRFAPYTKPSGIRRAHAPAMLGLEVGQELSDVAPESDVVEFTDWCLERIMSAHLGPQAPFLLEHLAGNDAFLDTPEGRVVVPGHAIESMWFVLHQAARRKDRALARRAIDTIRHHLEAGWDAEYGGIYLGIDCRGKEPWWPHAETKIWWPHTEAIYALLLTHHITGETWATEWLNRVWDWSERFFPDREHGEWRQRLDRQGKPFDEVVALPVKDPFHLPRALILATALLEDKSPLDFSALAD